MAKISVTLVALVVATLLIACSSEDKHWPDFSCHPANDTVLHKKAVNYNRMAWVDCHEPYENWNGKCPAIYMLVDEQVLIRKGKDNTVDFDSKAFIKYFAEEQDYNLENPGVSKRKLMEQIESGLNECRSKHRSEYEKLTFKNAPCEPWKNLLQCVNTTIGC